MRMGNTVFRCNYDEKNAFMVEAERLGLDASFLLRRMVHLFLTDKITRERVLNLEDRINYEWEF